MRNIFAYPAQMADPSLRSTTFDISGGKRPHIMIDFLAANNQWKKIRVLADSGNDITLLNENTAQELGYTSPEILSRAVPFKVQGIAASPMDFMMIKRPIRLAPDMKPIMIKIGIGPLRENLLGREDVLDKVELTISKSKLTITELRDNTIKFNPNEVSDKINSYVPEEPDFKNPNTSNPFSNWR